MSNVKLFRDNPYSKYLTAADYETLGEYVANFLLEQEPEDAKAVSECPECHGKIKKNGHSKDGEQRYKCLSCGHTFNAAGSYKTITYRSHVSKEKWHEFIVKTFENSFVGGNSIPSVKGINKNTAVLMHSKLSEQLWLLSIALDDIIERLTKKKRESAEQKQ